MKTKNGIVLLSALFLLSWGCTNDANNDEGGNSGTSDLIPYIMCDHPDYIGGYMDTIDFKGIGYLYLDSIPYEMRYRKDILSIVYDKEHDSVTCHGGYEPRISGTICNFPEFAKKWELGEQFYYEGKLYVTGEYPGYMIGGNMVLSILKLK
jgi:hypothetical protein